MRIEMCETRQSQGTLGMTCHSSSRRDDISCFKLPLRDYPCPLLEEREKIHFLLLMPRIVLALQQGQSKLHTYHQYLLSIPFSFLHTFPGWLQYRLWTPVATHCDGQRNHTSVVVGPMIKQSCEIQNQRVQANTTTLQTPNPTLSIIYPAGAPHSSS